MWRRTRLGLSSRRLSRRFLAPTSRLRAEPHEKLRRLQALLRREIPDGDPGAIFDRALTLLLEKVEKAKLAAVAEPQPGRPIRPETDKVHKPAPFSRHIPREVKRAVWERDSGQCAFVSPTGRRCREHTFPEFHHVKPQR